MRGVVFEVRRQAYFTTLSVVQFRHALEVEGVLEWFILNWASALDSPKNWLCTGKLACLTQGLKAVAPLRDLFDGYIKNNPGYVVKNVSGGS